MDVITVSIYRLLMAAGIVILLDSCRVALKIIWYDIQCLDEAEEQEKEEV